MRVNFVTFLKIFWKREICHSRGEVTQHWSRTDDSGPGCCCSEVTASVVATGFLVRDGDHVASVDEDRGSHCFFTFILLRKFRIFLKRELQTHLIIFC